MGIRTLEPRPAHAAMQQLAGHVHIDGGLGGRRDASGAVVVQGWRDCELPVER